MSNPKTKTYEFHWRDGTVTTSQGYDEAHAFSNAGYGGGAARSLDYWKEVKPPRAPKKEGTAKA